MTLAMASARASLTTMTTSENDFWRDIPGFEGAYKVSRDGDVVRVKTGRVLRPTTCQNGYQKVSLSVGGVVTYHLIHRLVAAAFLERKNPLAIEVNHKNFNKADNRIENLEWVTPEENIAYSYMNGQTDFHRPIRRTNKSGCAGVSRHGNGWTAKINIDGVCRYLGYYATLEDAIAARKTAEVET